MHAKPTMSFFTRLFITAMMLIGCLALATFSGCGSSTSSTTYPPVNDEALVRQMLDEQLSMVKNLSNDEMKSVLDEVSAAYAGMLPGVDTASFTKAIFSNFDYSIGDIKVDGNNAVATVTVTNVDLNKAIERGGVQFDAWLATQNVNELSEEQLYQKGVEYIIAEFKNPSSERKSTTVDVPCAKTNGTWVMSDQSALLNAISATM